MTMRIHGDKIEFPDGTEQFTASNGGGSTPTPEALVWEDKTADRAYGTVYTNTNDVPLYISVTGQCKELNGYIDLYVDGVRLVITGNTSLSDVNQYADIFGIVPSGSTYEVKSTGENTDLALWHEARMPLAIAVGGASGGGGTTDILPVLMSGSIASDGTIESGTGFTTVRSVGQTYIYFDKDIDTPYSVNVSNVQFGDQYVRDLTVGAKTEAGFKVYSYFDSAGQTTSSFDFTVTSQETIAVGGGSGGGTPEKMVWEITNDPIRTFDTVYTNDDDAPRFVNINIKYYSGGSSSCAFYIDGEEIAEMGRTQIPEDDPQHLYTTQMFVIPSGSTYELKKVAQSNISQWWEAKMPVAVGTGGIEEAPSDGKQYARQDEAWTEVTGGDSIWTESGEQAIFTTEKDTTVVAKANTGKYATFIVDNQDQSYAVQIRPDQSNALCFQNVNTGINSMKIATDGRVDIIGSLYVNNTPKSLDSMLVDLEKDVKLSKINSLRNYQQD